MTTKNNDLSVDIKELRTRIDELDHDLIDILSKRKVTIEKIGEIKKQQGTAALDQSRWQEVLDIRRKWADEHGIENEVVNKIFEAIHEWSIGIQNAQKLEH